VNGEGLGWVDGGDVGYMLARHILTTPGPVTIDAELTHTGPGGRAAFLLGLAAMIRATVVMSPEARATGLAPFSPDWTVAPAATLAEVMVDRGYTVESLAAVMCMTAAGRPTHAAGQAAMEDALRGILARRPMPPDLPGLLELATGVKAIMWQGLEDQYRADLRAGRTDTTKEV